MAPGIPNNNLLGISQALDCFGDALSAAFNPDEVRLREHARLERTACESPDPRVMIVKIQSCADEPSGGSLMPESMTLRLKVDGIRYGSADLKESSPSKTGPAPFVGHFA